MVISWGDDLEDATQGLDVLGVRGIDQAVELPLVNGITTISQRARYFSILPWAVGEYLDGHVSEGFDWDSFKLHLRRVEFMTLAASRLDHELNGADATGALGAILHQERLATLSNGGTVTFPDTKGGAMLGTYFAPCRSIGLLLDRNATVPFQLTPRGKDMLELRRERLRNSSVVNTISCGAEISRKLVEAAIPEFSLGALLLSTDESTLLRDAFVNPWYPRNEADRVQVFKVYEAFNGTISWASSMLSDQADSASGLITRNYENCTQRGTGSSIAIRWAEYEYRRRCHFALELMLSALTKSLDEVEKATVEQVVFEWFNTLEPLEVSRRLNEIWPDASEITKSNALQAVESIPKNLFSGEPIPTDDLRHLPTTDQAFVAVAVLVAVASQTIAIRRNGHFDRLPASPGERAVSVVEAAGDEPFFEFMKRLVELTALSHLQTTLRKMGAGQKCSLRFFPDGALLRSTRTKLAPGYSNDRLTNVLRILTDIGELRRANGKFAPVEARAA